MRRARDLRLVRAPGAQRNETNELARRVCLSHETARIAEHTPLAPTDEGRLLTLMETAGYAAAAVRDGRDDLRTILVALNVQTQLWISELDRDSAA